MIDVFGSRLWETIEKIAHNVVIKRLRHHGKFRGIVRDNKDPLNMGRIRAEIPKVLGKAIDENQWSVWALPCVPYAGLTKGTFFTPRVGDLIWMEFEGGKIEKPVWTGMMWGAEDMSPEMYANQPLDNTIETENYRISFQDTNSEDDEVYSKFKIESKISQTKIEIDETKETEQLIISQKDILGVDLNTVTLDGTLDAQKVTINNKENNIIEMDSTVDAEKITITDKALSTIVMDSTSGAENITVTETTNGNTLVLDSTGVIVTDAVTTNTITMSAAGIAINATGDVDIDGSANVTIDGATNVEATAGTTVTIDGGGSTIEVAAAGTTVSGGVITIGTVPLPPTGLCGLPACLFSGAPHTTNTMPGT